MRHKFVGLSLRILPFIACFSWVLSAYTQDLESLAKAEHQRYESSHEAVGKRSGQPYNIHYQHLRLKIDPAQFYLEGSVLTEVAAMEASFSMLTLDLYSGMTVDSIISNGTALAFVHSGDELKITTPMLDSGDILRFEVYYQGDPTKHDQKAYSVENHLTGPIAYTLSQPYGALGWWPCKQQLEDKLDSFDMSVQVPQGNKAAGLGILHQTDTLPNGDLVFHWKHRHPVATYLVAIAVSNYEEISHHAHFTDGDSLEILEYVYPEVKSAADTQVLKVESMLRLFDSLCGPYPFRDEKYGHAMWGKGGGMEHQTMSFVSDFDFNLIAHELAHQWFGDKITCGSWQDIWLNEGFATFFTAVAFEFLESPELLHEYLVLTRDRAMDQPHGSVYVDDTSNVSRIFSTYLSYRKGAMVLQMLRWELGDSVFFEGIRKYTSNLNICYNFAQTQDFIDAMEEVSGMDLSDFFDRWIYQEGYPLLTIRWNRNSAEEINLEISQTTSHPSVPFYPLKIPVLLRGETVDLLVMLDHSQAKQAFTIHCGFKVLAVEFDPEVRLLAKTNLIETSHLDRGEFIVFPSPVIDALNVFIRDQKIDRLEIYDFQGKLIYEQLVLNKKNEDIVLQSSFMESGLYVIKLYSGDSVYTRKFIKA